MVVSCHYLSKWMCGQDSDLTYEYISQRQLCDLRGNGMVLVFGISIGTPSVYSLTSVSTSGLEIGASTLKESIWQSLGSQIHPCVICGYFWQS